MKKPCIVQLGRIGDIINVLPAAKRMGADMLVAREFLPIFDRISGVKPIPWDGDMNDGRAASAMAARDHDPVHCAMIFGTHGSVRHGGKNFLYDQYLAMGMKELLPIEFNRRNQAEEKAIIDALGARPPYIVTCFAGVSSGPTPRQRSFLQSLVKCCRKEKVIDISQFKAGNFVDLLGLLENADLLVASDTAIIHLNRATKTPCIHIGRGGWASSGDIENTVFSLSYKDLPLRQKELANALRNAVQPRILLPQEKIKIIIPPGVYVPPPTPKPTVQVIEHPMAGLAYYPPPGIGDTASWIRNLEKYPPSCPYHVISDSETWGPRLRVPPITGNPKAIVLGVWKAMLKYMRMMPSEYVLWLEPDCRVKGKEWDKVLFDEARKGNPDFVCAGSPVPWNIEQYGQSLGAKVDASMRAYNEKTGVKLFSLTNEWIPPTVPAYYPNGALGIYHRRTLLSAMAYAPFTNTTSDMVAGLAIQRFLGSRDYIERFVPLTRELSFNAETFTKRDKQKADLEAGKVVAIHNIKDNWVPS